MKSNTGKATLAVSLSTMLLCAALSGAQQKTSEGGDDQLEQRFRAADLDGDGKLSSAEARQASWFVDEMQRFDSVDRDRSGTVTLAEILSSLTDQVDRWMDADSDRDGRVTESEAKGRSGLADNFRSADVDGDGAVTRSELEGMSQRSYDRDVELPSVAPNIIEKRF